MRPFVVLSLLFILAEICMISGCTKKEVPVKETVVQEVKEQPAPTPTQDQAIDAIRRAHPHAIQVCYDSVNDGFMIEYRVLADGEKHDGYLHGWKWLKNEKMYQAANGTWFTSERDDSDYVNISPDVFNLPCKKI